MPDPCIRPDSYNSQLIISEFDQVRAAALAGLFLGNEAASYGGDDLSLTLHRPPPRGVGGGPGLSAASRADRRSGKCRGRRSFDYGIVERCKLIATGQHANPAIAVFQLTWAGAVTTVENPVATMQPGVMGIESRAPDRDVPKGLMTGDLRAFG